MADPNAGGPCLSLFCQGGKSFRIFTEVHFHAKDVLIRVHVTLNAKEARVVRVGEAEFEVKVDERAIEGRANKRLLAILSEHFRVPKSRISIVSGAKSRDKLLEVMF
jgi:uncharacterized protein (TIGR00251 family)